MRNDNVNAADFNQLLKKINACKEAINWCEGKSLQESWDEATNSGWMLWLLCHHKNEATDRELRLIAVKCARQIQHLMKDQRSINALNVAEKFANGEATTEELAAARVAARAAAWAATEVGAWIGAWAATWAAARAATEAATGSAMWATTEAAAGFAQCKIIREYVPIIKLIF